MLVRLNVGAFKHGFALSTNYRAVATSYIDETIYSDDAPQGGYVILGYRKVYFHSNIQASRVFMIPERSYKKMHEFKRYSSVIGEDVDTKKYRTFRTTVCGTLRICMLN